MGLRGSGKTTLGERLAAKYRLSFVDLDRLTPGYLGARTVGEAWAKYGEAAFREAEVRALKQAIEEDPWILSLGGGTPTIPEARPLIRALKSASDTHSQVVYLRAPADVLAARLRGSGTKDRPSLTGADPIEEIAAVFALRDPLYSELADEVIEVGRMTPAEALHALDNILGL